MREEYTFVGAPPAFVNNNLDKYAYLYLYIENQMFYKFIIHSAFIEHFFLTNQSGVLVLILMLVMAFL